MIRSARRDVDPQPLEPHGQPLREVEYLGGVALFGMVKLVLGVGVMVLGALAFFSFDTWSLGFGLVPIVAILLVVGWAISLFVMGLVSPFRYGCRSTRVRRDVRLVAAVGRLLSDQGPARPDATAGAGVTDDARVHGPALARRPHRQRLVPAPDRRGRIGRDARAFDVVSRRDAARLSRYW